MSENISDLLADTRKITTFNPEKITQAEQYKLLAGSVVPRPIALVTTLGSEGPNAAPFSFFNVLGTNPPMLMFSVGMRKEGSGCKDTINNLKYCPEMVIHLVDEANAEQMNLCSTPFPPGVNELEAAKLELVASEHVKPPRILHCPVQFECELESLQTFGAVPYHLVIARIVRMHFRSDIVNEACHIDLAALNPIGRIPGPGMYSRLTDNFQLPPLF